MSPYLHPHPQLGGGGFVVAPLHEGDHPGDHGQDPGVVGGGAGVGHAPAQLLRLWAAELVT